MTTRRRRILCRSRSPRSGRALCRRVPGSHGEAEGRDEKRNHDDQQIFFHDYSFGSDSRIRYWLPDFSPTSVGHRVCLANTSHRDGTPPIGHTVRPYRGACETEDNCNSNRTEEGRSGFGPHKEAVNAEAKTAEEKQRQKIVGHGGNNLDRNTKRRAVPSGKIIDDRGKKHAEQAAAYR